ncbi:MAG: hypothetical protein ACI8TQ_003773, partial [Planctomycetota bacterium]
MTYGKHRLARVVFAAAIAAGAFFGLHAWWLLLVVPWLLARIIHEHADQTPRTTGTAGLLVPAGTLQILASSTTLQG